MEVYIHWTLDRELDTILSIENECFEFPWSLKDFKREAKRRNVVMMSAHNDNQEVVGYVVYEMHKTYVNLINFAVKKDLWKNGIGTQLIDKLKSKLHRERRNRMCLQIRESNIGAQLFFKKMGFRYFSTTKGLYSDTHEDAYNFRYCLAFGAGVEKTELVF